MVSPADQPIRYSTVEEITALFPLPLSKARLLLAKSMAAIEHGKSEPDGVAEREDRALWVLQGLEKMESLDGIIERFHTYNVTPSFEVNGVRAAISAMEAALEWEMEEETSKQMELDREQQKEIEWENEAAEQRRMAELERLQSTGQQGEDGEMKGQGVDVQEGLGGATNESSGDPLKPIVENERRKESRESDRGEITSTPIGEGKTIVNEGGDFEVAEGGVLDTTVFPLPRRIIGHDNEVCDRCRKSKDRRQERCSGAGWYSDSKIACFLCVKDDQACSFNASRETDGRSGGGRLKRKTSDDGEELEDNPSQMSRRGSEAVDDREDETARTRRPKRIKQSKSKERSEEMVAEEKTVEDEAATLAEELALAHAAVADGEAWVMRVKLKISRLVSRAETAGLS